MASEVVVRAWGDERGSRESAIDSAKWNLQARMKTAKVEAIDDIEYVVHNVAEYRFKAHASVRAV